MFTKSSVLVIRDDVCCNVFFFKFAVEVSLVCRGDLVYHCMMLSEEQWLKTHCLCEDVIDQLLAQWLDKSNTKKGFYLGLTMEKLSKELMVITPTCDITRTPRSLADVKDWKGINKYFKFSLQTKKW